MTARMSVAASTRSRSELMGLVGTVEEWGSVGVRELQRSFERVARFRQRSGGVPTPLIRGLPSHLSETTSGASGASQDAPCGQDSMDTVDGAQHRLSAEIRDLRHAMRLRTEYATPSKATGGPNTRTLENFVMPRSSIAWRPHACRSNAGFKVAARLEWRLHRNRRGSRESGMAGRSEKIRPDDAAQRMKVTFRARE